MKSRFIGRTRMPILSAAMVDGIGIPVYYTVSAIKIKIETRFL